MADATVAGTGERDVARLRDELLARLKTLREGLTDAPSANPVAQGAFEISRRLEQGGLSLMQLAAVARLLADKAFVDRAERLAQYIGLAEDRNQEAEMAATIARLCCDEQGEPLPFEAFQAFWRRPAFGIVFTAHPTFGLSRGLHAVITDLASGNPQVREAAQSRLAGLAHEPEAEITLAREHAWTQEALAHANRALESLTTLLVEEARRRYPQDWRRFDPVPLTLASWVGYDLDGRTDIRWWDSFLFRLTEKQTQLKRLRQGLAALTRAHGFPAEVEDELRALDAFLDRVLARCQRDTEAFASVPHDLGSGMSGLAEAANLLTEEGKDRLVDSDGIVDRLNAIIATVEEPRLAMGLMRLRAQVNTLGLGSAHIHFRINAAQVHNALRAMLGESALGDLSSRVALSRLEKRVAATRPEKVNFGTLELETATAIRQVVLIAQLTKHLDRRTPLRFLVAECESPATILGLILLARQFGVEELLDISPLFETPAALERGSGLIEALLETPAYRDTLRRRGRLCIQTGFSDAGRFIGQVGATLAIERLHMKLARLLADSGLDGVELVIFNTHGESMGRGAHPDSLHDRQLYILSDAARAAFARQGRALRHEFSFQGGDGFLYFGNPALARATLARLLEVELAEPRAEADRLYSDTDLSLDFFLRLKAYQEELFQRPAYRETLGAFGTNLLFPTGSRKSRRQHDAARPGDRGDPAQMRAIPNNAILQQLGFVANIVSGFSRAGDLEIERLIELKQASPRFDRILRLVDAAKQRSSLQVLSAYADLFDSGYWTSRAYCGGEAKLDEAFRVLAKILTGDRRAQSMGRLVNALRLDSIDLHRLLAGAGLDQGPRPSELRLRLDLLHAIRIALIMHIYLLAVRLPRFSTRNDLSREQILAMIVSLEVPPAVSALRETFPRHHPADTQARFHEPASYDPLDLSDYERLHTDYLEPMERAYAEVRRISVAIAHCYGAHG
ncbi:MAG: phosphoenolpyruvate carboxylase [Candidatus Competibacterales bacterium]|nr:phosphoenolpyruvate carboxylase [Candidatus Competibacterales bacterium]